jgi:hypothetical protein
VEFSTQYEVEAAYTVECPIVECGVYADSDCTTAVPEPVNTYVTVGALSPFAVSMNRAYVPGYAETTIYYCCKNNAASASSALAVR